MFLDESGEFGFEAGSSQYMLIAILSTDKPKLLKNVMRKEKKALHDMGWPRDIEVKGSALFSCHRNPAIPASIRDNRVGLADSIVRRILSTGATPHYFVVKKARIQSHLRKAPYGIAYNYFTGQLLCKIHNGNMTHPITLIVDRRNKETHAHMPFDGYIQTKVISECSHEHDFIIQHEDSEKWLGLQAVDFISWGLFRHYEHQDSQFRQLIRPAVGVCDRWYV